MGLAILIAGGVGRTKEDVVRGRAVRRDVRRRMDDRIADILDIHLNKSISLALHGRRTVKRSREGGRHLLYKAESKGKMGAARANNLQSLSGLISQRAKSVANAGKGGKRKISAALS